MEYGIFHLKLMGQGMSMGLANSCSNKSPMECVEKLVAAWRKVRGHDKSPPSRRIPLAVKPPINIQESWLARMDALKCQMLQSFDPEKVVQEMICLHKLANEVGVAQHMIRFKVRKAVREYFHNYNPECFAQMDIATLAVIDDLRNDISARQAREDKLINAREAEMFGYMLDADMSTKSADTPTTTTTTTTTTSV